MNVLLLDRASVQSFHHDPNHQNHASDAFACGGERQREDTEGGNNRKHGGRSLRGGSRSGDHMPDRDIPVHFFLDHNCIARQEWAGTVAAALSFVMHASIVFELVDFWAQLSLLLLSKSQVRCFQQLSGCWIGGGCLCATTSGCPLHLATVWGQRDTSR